MTIFHDSLSHLLMDFPRLARDISPQGVVSTTVGAIFRLIGHVRVTLSLHTDSSGQPLATSSAGLILPGEPAFVFTRPLIVRGTEFGSLSIDFLDQAAASDIALAVLETLVIQLALYGETERLKQAQTTLREKHTVLQEALLTEKTVIRAAGILAQDRGIPLAKANEWIRTEASRRARSTLSLAEMVIATLLPNMAHVNRSTLRPGRPVQEVAA